MPDIRRPTPIGDLNLPTVGDFRYRYRWSDGADFQAGEKLYFLIGAPGPAQIRWDFVISGAEASLKIESEVVATIAEGTPYWLMMVPATTTPTTEDEQQTGAVRKVNNVNAGW